MNFMYKNQYKNVGNHQAGRRVIKNNQCWDSYNYNIYIPLPLHGEQLYIHFPPNWKKPDHFVPELYACKRI